MRCPRRKRSDPPPPPLYLYFHLYQLLTFLPPLLSTSLPYALCLHSTYTPPPCAPCVIVVLAGLEDLHDAVDQASLDGSGHTSRDLFREELRKQEQLGSSLGVHLKIPHLQEPHRRHRVARGDQTTLAKMA